MKKSEKISKSPLKIGDYVRIKDGIGKSCNGYIYDTFMFEDIELYRVFSKSKIYSLKGNPNELVRLQCSYSANLLTKIAETQFTINDLIVLGLDINRKTFQITANPNYPKNSELYMSYE